MGCSGFDLLHLFAFLRLLKYRYAKVSGDYKTKFSETLFHRCGRRGPGPRDFSVGRASRHAGDAQHAERKYPTGIC
jgi:hypothetical protein